MRFVEVPLFVQKALCVDELIGQPEKQEIHQLIDRRVHGCRVITDLTIGFNGLIKHIAHGCLLNADDVGCTQKHFHTCTTHL
jgi:hypothetical protein